MCVKNALFTKNKLSFVLKQETIFKNQDSFFMELKKYLNKNKGAIFITKIMKCLCTKQKSIFYTSKEEF